MPRIAVLKAERCNPKKCNYLCIEVCPVNRQGKDCITVSPEKKVAIAEDLCIGCGICQRRCPFQAISIVNLPKELAVPVHAYGRNGFHLYKLPWPIFGKVVGIAGPNGIGKSTALAILSGQLVPNLGKAKAEYPELVKMFKGKEAQVFFKALGEGRIKPAFKLQNIAALAKLNVSVKEHLETAEAIEVAKALGLKDFEKPLSKLSGGELQKIGIAKTAASKANLYIFDEFSSYLDVEERLKAAKLIANLTKGKSAVIVVDHDLIVLDAISDLIHIGYGKPEAYGVVSLPLTAKEGLNVYLDGFIREENVRFREAPIKFLARRALPQAGEVLVSWKELEKKLDGFSLSAEHGQIMKREIVGIVGRNAIGKTTFIRLLAGELQPDSGLLSKEVVIAHKPQYISVLEGQVGQLIKEDELALALGLSGLMQREISTLSGGELQRFAIARCLQQDAELYLLDEPSAYLDIEQRLGLAKLIRDFVERKDCAMAIVDHDLLFIESIAQRVIRFTGEPGVKGIAVGPLEFEQAMNTFVHELDITMRRDPSTGRPRINKFGSRLDRLQRQEGRYYV